MFRKTFPKRENFEQSLDSIGFQYHKINSTDETPYWTEGVAYEFTLDEVEKIESATEEVHGMCMETVEAIIKSGDYPEQFLLGDTAKTLIEASWKSPHVYGRFDFVYDNEGSIKLYEYNADTPTSLLEAGVAQWQWLEEAEGIPNRDQFNSIHDKLIDRWKELKVDENSTLYLFATELAPYEDWGNLEYMADVATQAGWNVHLENIENIGWDEKYKEFVDRNEYALRHAFKLYPWEWLVDENFGANLIGSKVQWFEPAWKMLLSNKAILPILWERYENHPNLLPSYFDFKGVDYVRKPILGREGANVYRVGELIEGSHFVDDYDNGYISQAYCPLPEFDGMHPVIGSWVIGDLAAGMGIREDSSLISGNGSHFVPHYFVEN